MVSLGLTPSAIRRAIACRFVNPIGLVYDRDTAETDMDKRSLMPSSSDHPDRKTLESWLAFSLPAEVAAKVEAHISDCSHCAKRIKELESDTDKQLASHVRAMYRGDLAKPPQPGAETSSSKPLVTEIVGSELPPTGITSSTIHGPEAHQSDTIQAVTVVWEKVCEQASSANETLKGNRAFAESHLLDLPIRTRTICSSDDSPKDANGGEADDYELLNVIGRGGMGIVYNARQASVDRIVAIKMLKKADQKEVSRRRLFLQEAVVTADLDHPNIVPVHELGTNDEGTLFYSMKKVQGKSWNDLIGRISQDENLDLLMRVCDAVGFAHSRGIVHRDLKPENVMRGEFGEVWLMDWGLAQPTRDYRKSNLSSSQQMGGTPAYMAPEMTDPKKRIGPLSDVYLLGAILFEIVSGTPPHRGSSVLQCLFAAARNKIVATTQRGGLLDVAYKAMSTEPDDRYQSVAEFQDALRHRMSHSESLAIAANAQRLLGEAKENRKYQDFIRSIYGFEQACELFPDNEEAVLAIADARYEYARCATERGDFDLAATLLDIETPKHAELLRDVEGRKFDQQARLARARRQQVAFRSVLVATVLFTICGIAVTFWLRFNALQLANVNEPAMHASLSLQSGLRRSLSALRGWVALGDPQFKAARALAWKAEIRPSLERLHSLTEKSADSEDLQRCIELDERFDELYDIQWWIEDVAQTPGNEPARNLLLTDIEPIEVSISAALAGLVDLQRAADAGDAATWEKISALQLAFVRAHRHLTHFVDKADEVNERSFNMEIERVESVMTSLDARAAALTAPQQELIRWSTGEVKVYRDLCQRAIRLRKSDQANVALWRLRTKAMPISRRAEQILTDIVDNQRVDTRRNSQQINRISSIAIAIGTAVALAGLVAGWFSLFRDRVQRRRSTLLAMMWVAIAFAPAPCFAQGETQKAGVESADVFVRVALVLDELERLRAEMGKPKSDKVLAPIAGAAPHEVYFQALTLFEKADQLCFEQLRRRMPQPITPTGQIEASDVLPVVDSVLGAIVELNQHVGISERPKPPLRDAAHTPTDVLTAIILANRQLNLLVERRFTSRDVFQQITLAVSYGSTLLSSFPDATRLPDEPDFQPQKTPADVYRRLLDCYALLQQIAKDSKVQMLEFRIDEKAPRTLDSIAPSDVYDIASLLVSELAYLHSLRGDLPPVKRVFSPGQLFPSHVYQRAGMLESQIEQLAKAAKENPDWLGHSK